MEAFRIWLQEEPALFLGAAAALMLMSGSLYERQREHKTTQTLMLKGGTTLIAALVAGAAVWQQNSLAACFVLAATLCCAVADVLLEQIFNFGACVFALGHICYLAAYFSEAHFSIATAVSLCYSAGGDVPDTPKTDRRKKRQGDFGCCGLWAGSECDDGGRD